MSEKFVTGSFFSETFAPVAIDEALKELGCLLTTIQKYGENNTWILLDPGECGRDQDPDYMYSAGQEFENSCGAIDELIHTNFFGNGTLFIAFHRELTRHSGKEDLSIDGLADEFSNKFEFIEVNKNIKREITAKKLVNKISKEKLCMLNKMLSKRWRHEAACRMAKSEWENYSAAV
ncbi:MAG: hypothetical protein IJI14_10530 [Anaerolineaceae bacterium]|nr:hypothetical protein [Anaerolineaceae bacterium]